MKIRFTSLHKSIQIPKTKSCRPTAEGSRADLVANSEEFQDLFRWVCNHEWGIKPHDPITTHHTHAWLQNQLSSCQCIRRLNIVKFAINTRSDLSVLTEHTKLQTSVFLFARFIGSCVICLSTSYVSSAILSHKTNKTEVTRAVCEMTLSLSAHRLCAHVL